LHFVNTPLTLELCARVPWLERWRESIEQAVETGTTFSFGFPLEPPEAYNRVGQQYCGPVVLIVDALCYSTTDIFAGGFQDHSVGFILGTAGNMGAGGANVWTHELLRQLLPGDSSPLKPLPSHASFRVSIRRTTRVGERSGVPLEGLGVLPDALHRMTADDLLEDNVDLINHAAEILASMPARALDASVTAANGKVKITATTRNISRLDVYLGDRPQTSLDVADGETAFSVSRDGGAHEAVELRGYTGHELVVVKRIPL
jgi:hypothetical protein